MLKCGAARPCATNNHVKACWMWACSGVVLSDWPRPCLKRESLSCARSITFASPVLSHFTSNSIRRECMNHAHRTCMHTHADTSHMRGSLTRADDKTLAINDLLPLQWHIRHDRNGASDDANRSLCG